MVPLCNTKALEGLLRRLLEANQESGLLLDLLAAANELHNFPPVTVCDALVEAGVMISPSGERTFRLPADVREAIGARVVPSGLFSARLCR